MAFLQNKQTSLLVDCCWESIPLSLSLGTVPHPPGVVPRYTLGIPVGKAPSHLGPRYLSQVPRSTVGKERAFGTPSHLTYSSITYHSYVTCLMPLHSHVTHVPWSVDQRAPYGLSSSYPIPHYSHQYGSTFTAGTLP